MGWELSSCCRRAANIGYTPREAQMLCVEQEADFVSSVVWSL